MPVIWSPTDKNSNIVLSNGNLTVESISHGYYGGRSTECKSDGKWYYEIFVEKLVNCMIGVSNSLMGTDTGHQQNCTVMVHNGYLYNTTEGVYSQIGYKIGDTVGMAIDAKARTINFYINGIPQGVVNIKFTGNIYPAYFVYLSKFTTNFGVTGFKFSPPDGYSGFESKASQRRFFVWVGGV